MANMTYALLPTQVLLVDRAPRSKRVEFSPEIRQAVGAGAILARQGVSAQPLDSDRKPLNFYMIIYTRCLIQIISSSSDT